MTNPPIPFVQLNAFVMPLYDYDMSYAEGLKFEATSIRQLFTGVALARHPGPAGTANFVVPRFIRVVLADPPDSLTLRTDLGHQFRLVESPLNQGMRDTLRGLLPHSDYRQA